MDGMTDRLDNFWFRLALISIGVAAIVIWTTLSASQQGGGATGDAPSARVADSQATATPAPPPPPVAVTGTGSPPAGPTAGEPRLFLARQRVKRLPPLELLGGDVPLDGPAAAGAKRSPAAIGTGEIAGEARPGDGPRLFSPAGAMPEAILSEHDTTSGALDLPDAPTPHPPVSRERTLAELHEPFLTQSRDGELASGKPAPDVGARGADPDTQSSPAEAATSRTSLSPPDNGRPINYPQGLVNNSPRLDVSDDSTGMVGGEPSAIADAAPEPARSEQLERIARQADRHTEHAFELAGRKAYFAARAEFIIALRMLAQALDAERGGSRHSEDLAAGLAAIEEADDFIPSGSRLEADLNLAVIVKSHRTPALKQAELTAMAPMAALRAYFTFAQQRLAEAMDGELAGSMALHGLGKLHAALAREPNTRIVAAEPKAMAYFQAALLTFPNNLMAANDLGVLLARSGNWEQARRFLEHAVAVNPQSESWRNLMKVYQHVGDAARAEHARRMVARLNGPVPRGGGRGQAGRAAGQSPSIVWMKPTDFSQTHMRRDPVPTQFQQPRQPMFQASPTQERAIR